ncbi:hypothetical protein FOZ60_013479 [Perkinsus olseni]|uniref:Uncharacterized protein n=1 Tax=Perkinsus olseni TaxID=32597 RepID=A0A7J6N9F7_PEROL|nr:hypothetical protein FOZ60_013479 [Perkinsus olseni]
MTWTPVKCQLLLLSGILSHGLPLTAEVYPKMDNLKDVAKYMERNLGSMTVVNMDEEAVIGDVFKNAVATLIQNYCEAPVLLAYVGDWDAADEDSIDWIVTDMPFGNCRGPKKADMARVLHAVSLVLKPETGRCELLSKGYKRLDAAAA